MFQAIDFKGNVITTDTVDVTNTLPIPSQLNDLRITEVMYHPKFDDAYGNNDLEFIELTNIGQSPLPLKNAEISGAASFTLPDVTLNPGQYVLIVGNKASFEAKYGPGLPIINDDVDHPLNGNLSNSSEQIILTSALGQVIHSFTYSDLWYPTTDGDGYSLVIRDDHGALTNWLDAPGWRASGAIGGSPGAADTVASATIAGRHVFYNQIEVRRQRRRGQCQRRCGDRHRQSRALLPGGTASFANYTSFNRGLNGIMVDIAGLPPAQCSERQRLRLQGRQHRHAQRLGAAGRCADRLGAAGAGVARLEPRDADLAHRRCDQAVAASHGESQRQHRPGHAGRVLLRQRGRRVRQRGRRLQRVDHRRAARSQQPGQHQPWHDGDQPVRLQPRRHGVGGRSVACSQQHHDRRHQAQADHGPACGYCRAGLSRIGVAVRCITVCSQQCIAPTFHAGSAAVIKPHCSQLI